MNTYFHYNTIKWNSTLKQRSFSINILVNLFTTWIDLDHAEQCTTCTTCTTQRTSSGCSVRFITGLDCDTSTPAVLQRLDSQNINREYFVFTHCCIWYTIVALKILKHKCWIFFPTSAFQPLLDFWNGYPTKWKCKNSNVDILVNSFFCLHCKQQHLLPLKKKQATVIKIEY